MSAQIPNSAAPAKPKKDPFVIKSLQRCNIYCERPSKLSMLQDLFNSGELKILCDEGVTQRRADRSMVIFNNFIGEKVRVAHPNWLCTLHFNKIIVPRYESVNTEDCKALFDMKTPPDSVDLSDTSKYCKVSIRTIFVASFIHSLLFINTVDWHKGWLTMPKGSAKIKGQGVNKYFGLDKYVNENGDKLFKNDPFFDLQRVGRILEDTYLLKAGYKGLIPESQFILDQRSSIAQKYHVEYQKKHGQIPRYTAMQHDKKYFVNLNTVFVIENFINPSLVAFCTEASIAGEDLP